MCLYKWERNRLREKNLLLQISKTKIINVSAAIINIFVLLICSFFVLSIKMECDFPEQKGKYIFYSQGGMTHRNIRNGLQDIMNCEMNPIPQLEKKQMPTKIAELNWKTETDEIKLKKCVVAPITYMEQYKEEISSAAIHVEWKKKYLKNEEKTIQKIETYLYNSHDQSFRYRIYSPEIELRNNTIKVMTSLQAINKVALLFMAVFLTGMIAIYQLRFEHREESYGISLAYGAQYKELYWEIFCEILLLNSIGTIIGIVIGYLVTYYVDFGIMISVVNVQGSWYTFLSAYGLCVVLSSFVSVITFRKLKKKKIIELLNVY